MCPRRDRHGIVQKFCCGTEVDSNSQTDDSCCGGEDTETEKCDDGTFDTDIDLCVSKKWNRTTPYSDQLLESFCSERTDVHESAEPVREDGDRRQCKTEAGDVALSLAGTAFYSFPVHLDRRTMEELIDGGRSHDKEEHGHDCVDRPLVCSLLFCDAQQCEANSPFNWDCC